VQRIRCAGAVVAPAAFRSAPTQNAKETVVWIGQSVPAGAVIEIEFGANADGPKP
jgi:hypothetical protein